MSLTLNGMDDDDKGIKINSTKAKRATGNATT